MTRPLPRFAARCPDTRPPDGHAGLWFDKFCDRWRVQGTLWVMKSEKGDDGSNPKLEWIKTLTTGKVGTSRQIDECASRLMRLFDRRGGRCAVFTTESRFVTGLGRSHPVENGFALHPTLGTPYLPGSSVKGLVRAWAKLGAADPSPPCEIVRRLLGDRETAGGISFLDAVPIAPVQLEADVMTPHYAGWTEDEPPGDWRSPTPIPFLVTAAGTPFLFGVVPRRAVPDDLCTVMPWLCSALAWTGGGAKTAVGYGRFGRDDDRTAALMQRLRDQDAEHEERVRAEHEAGERETRLAALTPIGREIEEVIGNRQDRNMPEVVAIMQAVESGRWADAARIEVAGWLMNRMKEEKRWKETSRKKNPAKDRDHQNTLRVKGWLEGG